MRPRLTLAATIAAVAALAAPSAGAHITDFAPLTPDAVAPGPGDVDASGAALVDLKPPFEQMCGGLRQTGLGSVTGWQLHRGAPGSSGPVVVDLTPTLGDGPACVSAPFELLREIRSNPNGFYLEVETGGFPDGALRGQLDHSQDESTTPRTTGPGHLFASMNGLLAAPDPGDPDGRGVVFVDVRAAVGLACVDERYAGLDAPTEMHIHRGARGRAGSVAIDVGPALTGTRCVKGPKPLLARIAEGPRRFYLDMHTGPFPGGAVRGQLTPSD
jgi:CHRD domain